MDDVSVLMGRDGRPIVGGVWTAPSPSRATMTLSPFHIAEILSSLLTITQQEHIKNYNQPASVQRPMMN
jgi:hypothetical protein